MRALIAIILILVTGGLSAQSIQDRVIHNDPSTYRNLTDVHAGAGSMGFTQLIGRNDLSTNFLYLHTGTIAGKSGIGHHFHHSIEEMYVLLSGEAEFTINGRTSKIKAPALVPCKMGDSHAIYNTTDQPVQWLNFAVSTVKARGDAFDLGDDRVGATLDPIPAFVSGKLDKELLKPERTPYVGKGVSYRRVLGPEVFSTDWSYVDHLTIPSGTKTDPYQLEGMEAVYYVINGSGTVTADGKSGTFGKDDAFYGRIGENITLENTGNETVELLIIGISASKKWDIKKPLKEPKAMVLEMDFVVEKKNAQAFEEMYYSIYVPAMIVQDGYLSSKLMRLYSPDQAKEIEAEPTTYNYQILISFETEEKRRKWVASDQHQIAWPAATSLAKEFKWRGYHVMGDDDQ
ncbi:cupin domain-containing protein [Allomuricauda sp. CP2A]|jgi:mannose-6-phosphate isomerase-like protein (cupin superfamily)/heme-degrading monooxygenase HmoA|uniref:cupin domain-containing protein n=1 Tax=Allomuricauda sp. CP2A TaxID=1848189 RepID=UPI0008361765|nr:cupin domain-containing protein [Muricauda sp. CP2A]